MHKKEFENCEDEPKKVIGLLTFELESANKDRARVTFQKLAGNHYWAKFYIYAGEDLVIKEFETTTRFANREEAFRVAQQAMSARAPGYPRTQVTGHMRIPL